MHTTTHLRGTGDPTQLAGDAPYLDLTLASPITIDRVEILQVISEIACDSMQAALPPGLHPSIPGHVAWQVWKATESPVGPFRLAFNRIGCRSGVKPRCLATLAVTDSPALADLLRTSYGYRVELGEIDLQTAYDRVRGVVRLGGRDVLDMELRDPSSFTGGTIRYAANLTMPQTDRGLRLVQVDADYVFQQVDRGRAVVHGFDAAAWHAPAVVPTSPMVGTKAVASVTLHEVRFIADPSLLAVDGTEDLRPRIRAAVS